MRTVSIGPPLDLRTGGLALGRYLLPVVAAGLALGLNLLLSPLQARTYPTFLAAVLLAAWFGGHAGGLVTTGLTTTVNAYFLLSPAGPAPAEPFSTMLRALTYAVSALLISTVGVRLRQTYEARRRPDVEGPPHGEAIRQHDAHVPLLVDGTRDINDRPRADEAGRATDAKLRGVLELAPDAIVIVDGEGRIVLVNTQAQQLFRYAPEELVGQHVEMLLPIELRERHETHRTTFQQGPKRRPMGTGLELSARRKDGTTVPVEISLSPMQTEEGLLVISAIRDITDRREAEARIKALNEDLERRVSELAALNRELEAFSYSVSHDLRAPLRSIDGFSQALLEEYAGAIDEPGQDYLRRVRAATQRMGDLIDDLLNLSRVTRRELRYERVDLSEMARTIAGQLQRTDPARRVDFTIADGLVVRGDPHLLRVALENLLGNAWKFTTKQPAPRVEFGVRERDGQRVYFVRDNGVGFDMAYSGKLFGAFQRLHRNSEFPGTGIGLATVQRIVTRHGGRVWAEAEAGNGATFHFTL
jgi:PAS domain S-box-containing protein